VLAWLSLVDLLRLGSKSCMLALNGDIVEFEQGTVLLILEAFKLTTGLELNKDKSK